MATIAPLTEPKKKPNAMTAQTPPSAIKPLQLKIPATVKNDFKAYAALHGKSMSEMFLEIFEEHK